MMRNIILIVIILFLIPQNQAAGLVELKAVNSMERIPHEGAVAGDSKVIIKAARNEVESFQVAITSSSASYQITDAYISDLADSTGLLINKSASTFFRIEYVNVKRLSENPDPGFATGYYADPLIPFVNPMTGNVIRKSGGTTKYALPIDVSPKLNGAIWVDIKVPADAKPGDYTGTFTVLCSDLSRVSIPITLTVWDFILPDRPSCSSCFGAYNNIEFFFGSKEGTSEYALIEQLYAQEIARHRINPPVPRRFLPEVNSNGDLIIIRAMNDSLIQFTSRYNVTSMEVPYAPYKSNASKRALAGYVNYLQSLDLLDGSFCYIIDEPSSKTQYQYIIDHSTHIYTGVPNISTLVTEQTYPQNPSWPDINGFIDIWCPIFDYIDEDTINQKIASGNKVWSYTALSNGPPSYHPQYERVKNYRAPYWQIDRPLTNYRVPLWFNYRYHITGLLYYNVTSSGVPDPWNNPLYSEQWNGDGVLFYPATPCGFKGPVPTMRLKNLRDGLEDYEYMMILQKLKGYDAVMNYVKSVSTEWWSYSRNPEDFLIAREEIANAISFNQPLLPPSDVTVTDINFNLIHFLKITWNPSSSEQNGAVKWYRIYRSMQSLFTNPIPITQFSSIDSLKFYEKFCTILVDSVKAGITKFEDPVPVKGVPYYYWIQSVGERGASQKVASGYSTSVEEVHPTFFVYPPFPNPFNPRTTITITIPKESHLELTIYNISGQKVATLVDEKVKQGYYSYSWNSKGMPSGIYFCKTRTDMGVDIKKIMLLK
jgi:hypothetical protein